jgi:hypothetical protein
VVARLADPKINLAAYGGILFPLALIIESPIIMLLAASTALSKDWASYLKLRRFMMIAGAALTALHILIVFTPIYDLIVVGVLKANQATVEPGRVGLMIMIPWTWSIAYRRFHQGVMIRFGHSRAVSVGTAIRLTADAIVLTLGYLGAWRGIVVAASATVAGVISEAIYAGLAVRPVLRSQLLVAPPVKETLTLRSFLAFYVPLVMTSLLFLIGQPIGSAGLNRMPLSLDSLAAWPVLTGLIFMTRSLGVAYNEVVVALLDEPGSAGSLRRFAGWLFAGTSAFLLLIAATPLSGWWFERLSALSPDLAGLARSALWIAIPLPAMSVLQSWFQGSLMHGRQTRSITESVVLYLGIGVSVLLAGIAWGRVAGIYVGVLSLVAGTLAQTAWLWRRSQPVIASVRQRDAEILSPQRAPAN